MTDKEFFIELIRDEDFPDTFEEFEKLSEETKDAIYKRVGENFSRTVWGIGVVSFAFGFMVSFLIFS